MTEHAPTPWAAKGPYFCERDGKGIGACCDASPSNMQDTINAAFIVLAVNSHDQLIAALKAISTHWANQYDHPNMEAPMYQGPYGTGVTDGHRACKAIADKALALLDGIKGA